MLETVRRLWAILPPSRRWAALLYLPLSFLASLLELGGIASVVPFLLVVTNPEFVQKNRYLQGLYSGLGFSSQRSFLLFCGCLILAAMLVREAFSTWLQMYRARFVSSVQNELSERLLEIYLSRSYRFLITRHSATLSQNILIRVNSFMANLFQPLLTLLSSSLTTTLLLGALCALSWRIAIFSAIVFVLVNLVIHSRLHPWLTAMAVEVQRLNQSRFRLTSEAIQGFREAKLLGCELFYIESYMHQNARLLKLQQRRIFLNQIPRWITRFSLLILVMVGVLFLLWRNEQSRLVPIMVVYLLLILRLVPAIQNLFTTYSGLLSEQVSLRDLYEDLALDGRLVGRQLVVPKPLRNSLEFQGVVLRYQPERPPALSGISFCLEAGEQLAIVGATGAGKTSLLDVLTGLIAPDQGQVVVDGESLSGDPVEWRANIGYVPQEHFLVDASLAQNIAFGVPAEDIDLARVESAGRLAVLHDFVTQELSAGYETLVGERGVAMSKGQRQRIGIARALYRDPQILVLDEATSNLDPVTESKVLKGLRDLPGRTLILVTHRLQTALSCGRLLVLDGGRLVGDGSESELRENCPEFLALMTVSGG